MEKFVDYLKDLHTNFKESSSPAARIKAKAEVIRAKAEAKAVKAAAKATKVEEVKETPAAPVKKLTPHQK